MILGVGVDLAFPQFFSDCLNDSKTSVVNRTFTQREINLCQNGNVPVYERLAARFAAKEAFFKAINQNLLCTSKKIGTFNPKEVEVLSDPVGRPYIELHGGMAELSSSFGVKHISLSISHEFNMAIAFVLLEGTTEVN